ncbi:MAG: type 4a pilus biogenesis protein PilO [Phycisphaerales bacterium]|nr:type 4a pilus biogenesis protein PilO [Phycisphaerales bacterium]
MHIGPKQMFYLAGLVAIPVCAFFFVFKPQNEGIEQAKREIELKRTMLGKLREATAKTADLRKANEQIAESITSIQERLPTDKEMDSVLRDVAQIAATCGLDVPQFRRQDKNLPAGLASEQQLTVQLVGDFEGMYRFFLELERLHRITRVTDMKFTRFGGKNDEDDGKVRADLTLSIFYQSAEPEKGKAAQASAGGNQ